MSPSPLQGRLLRMHERRCRLGMLKGERLDLSNAPARSDLFLRPTDAVRSPRPRREGTRPLFHLLFVHLRARRVRARQARPWDFAGSVAVGVSVSDLLAGSEMAKKRYTAANLFRPHSSATVDSATDLR